MLYLHQLDTNNKRDVERFVTLPFQLYRNCAHWVPPLLSDFRENLNRSKHPFYAHSAADFFMVEDNGRPVGRVAAIANKQYNQYRHSRTAFFGYFEAVDDEKVGRMLLTAVSEWAARRYLNEIIGPRGVNGLDGNILVEGFDQPPALTIPYNPPYYDRLIQSNGFRKRTDYLSGYLPGNYQLPARIHELARRVQERRGYWIKSFRSKRELRRWIPQILAVHQLAFSQTGSYYPPTQAEIERTIRSIMLIADLSLIKLVMKDEQIVGFIFAYPDVSEGLKKAQGHLLPTGWLHLLHSKRRTKWVNINGIGLLPQVQGLGGNAVLYSALEATIHQSQFEHVEVVLVDEANRKSIADMEQIGVRWYKRHRQYQCHL
jgi:hypothetical protein